MDTKRLIIFMALSMAIVFFWQSWEQKHHPQPPVLAQSAQTGSSAPAAAGGTASGGAALPADAAVGVKLASAQRLTVTTDIFNVDIDAQGGDIRGLSLRQHGDVDDPSRPFALFESGGERTYIAQTGLFGANLPNLPSPRTVFALPAGPVAMADGQQTLKVTLSAPDVGGIKVSKTFTFTRGSYVIDVAYDITNGTGQPIAPTAYFRLLRDSHEPKGGTRWVRTFTGPAVYTAQKHFEKVSFADIDKGKADLYTAACDNGWIGVVQHYFVAAWLPPSTGTPAADCSQHPDRRFEIKKTDQLYSVGLIEDLGTIAPGASARISVPLFAGPEEHSIISKLAPGLELTKDFGIFKVISEPLFWLLEQIQKLVGNWGWSIILLTILIKAVLFPLSAASYRSMAQMKLLAPRMQRLKEQYGDDRQKLHQAMMEMYKVEKINPLGGCLPMLLQMPIFMALYWALLSSVELRQAPWILWIHDLSHPDPYYILPALLTLTMWLQTFFNPPASDPMQDKMMKIMPLAFGVMFFFFPVGLVLYWIVNNLLTMAQQWYVKRTIEQPKPPAAKKAHGK